MGKETYYKHKTTEVFYKTGGPYGDRVWVLLPFGWIISGIYTHEDLKDKTEFELTNKPTKE